MVTGGLGSGSQQLDSTEIYRNNANVWSILPAVLPSPTFYLSAGKIDDTIFVIGKRASITVIFHFCYIKLIQKSSFPSFDTFLYEYLYFTILNNIHMFF